MHSSRMRTARLLPVSPSMHCFRGVPWGCTCPGTPPVNRMADRCKNITLLQTSFAGGNKLTLNCFQEFFRNINAAIETLQHLLTWVTSQHTPKATLDSPAGAAENTLYYLDRNMLFLFKLKK